MRRSRFGLCLTLAVGLCPLPAIQAQDITITNLAQLAQEAFSPNHSLYLPWTPWQWRAYSTDGGEPCWIDCSQVACADLLSTSTNSCATIQLHGMTVTSVVLTKNILTGQTLLQLGCSTDAVASIQAPSGYAPGAEGEDIWVWREWQQLTNCPNCWGIEGEVPPPTVALKALLADASDYDTWSNAEAAATSASEDTGAGEFAMLAGGGMMLMDNSDSCTITDESAPFSVLSVAIVTNGVQIAFESCSDHIYGMFSSDDLSNWVGVTAMWGEDGSTSWTDTTTAGVSNRFYKVVRIPPDEGFNSDPIPSGWAVDNGLNPLDPNLDTEDPDTDGQENYAEYIADTSPTNSSSYFHVTDVLVVGSDVRVFFTSSGNRYYNLQRSAFISGPYSNVVQNIPGNGGIQWAKDIGAASLGDWYRVSVFLTNLPPDTDSDGMPDLWTEQYFGHPTGLAADPSRATDNPDGDCFNNLQEYQNGTDPTNRDPLVSVSGGTTLCAGQTLNLLTLTIPGAAYSWTGPSGFTSTNQNPPISGVTTNEGGTYCVVVAANGCTSTPGCVSVTINPLPTAMISGIFTNCPGGPAPIQIAFTGASPWIVTWSDGVIETNLYNPWIRTARPFSTTIYTITALSDAHCSGGTFSGSATAVVHSVSVTSSVTVSNEVLVLYNSNLADSVSCKDYYINHRPGFSNANLLACSCTTTGIDGFERITSADLTNQIINPIIGFIQSNPAKSIHYIVLMYGMPSRVIDGSTLPPSVQLHISHCMSDAGYTSGPYYENSTCPFVATNFLGTTCLVTALNLATLADCTAYVDKVASMYTGNVIISANVAGYTNRNYYLDDARLPSYSNYPLGAAFKSLLLAQNPLASVSYSANTHILSGSDIRGYFGWGNNGGLGPSYATNGLVVWSGNSSWWIIATVESYNGIRDSYQGDVEEWFAANAWGGANYSNTPVGAVSHVEEPSTSGINSSTYMSLWEEGYLFSECAWASRNTDFFQAIGDPLVTQ